ncbi:fluoride efflux transporter CrcB [Priestia koreensis]|uniref:fluoride efflux transporter CrcB n=1 Tax=Priestia koreensis TaxID=284581 RepID=UPI0028F70674|nr:fluoride efflux transporter CrcB [Priestia koreensis]
MKVLFVGIGGIIGSLLRYYTGVFTHTWWGSEFPLGTLLINLIGSFFLGWFTYRIIKRNVLHPAIATGIGTGIVGAFTTFSTFSVETVTLMKAQLWGFALLYVLISAIGGLLMSWAGCKLGSQSRAKMKGGLPS